MSDEPMKSAMSVEEWERFLGYHPSVMDHMPGSLEHAKIARALYGQPFGFTQEDVKLLKMVAWKLEDYAPEIEALVARIAALLPPTP